MNKILKYRSLILLALLLVGALIAFRTLIPINDNLVFSDYTHVSSQSFSTLLKSTFYQWSEGNFGFTLRYTLINPLYTLVALLQNLNIPFIGFFLRIYLPFVLSAVSVYVIVNKLAPSKLSFIPAIFYVANPVVYGDFLTGQTLWTYTLVPWVIYWWIAIFIQRRVNAFSIIVCGLLLFILYGLLPPILVPMALILAGLTVFGFAINLYHSKSFLVIKDYVIAGCAILGVFVILSMPYLLATSSGQESFTQNSTISDYLHNYATTSIDNTLRLGGNQGNGQLTLGYNVFSLTNIAGYAIIGFVLLALAWSKRQNYSAAYIEMLALLVILLIMLGFVNLVTENKDFGINLFNGQWMLASIRNPTKIFIILLVFLTLILGYALKIIQVSRPAWARLWIVGGLLLTCVFIYGWPIYRGDLGLLHSKSITEITPKSDSQDLIERVGKTDKRALVIPTTHQDEINFQNHSTSLNTIKFGGALPYTVKMTKAMNESFNKQNPIFKEYLEITGISKVYLKKKADKSTVLFGSELTYRDARNFLQSIGLEMTYETSSYAEFTHDKARPLIYSPNNIASINTDDISPIISLTKNRSVISNPSAATSQYSRYRVLPLAKDAVIKSGLAQIYDTNNVQLYVELDGSGVDSRVRISKTTPLTKSRQVIYEKQITKDTDELLINGEPVELSSRGKLVNVDAGKLHIEYIKRVPVNIDKIDPSFESDSPSIIDSSKGRAGKPKMQATLVQGGSHGEKSLLIGTTSHLAAVRKKIEIVANKSLGNNFRLSFDYKHSTGNPGSYSVFNDENKTPFASDVLSNNSDWTKESIVFEKNQIKNYLQVYLYTDTNDGQQSQNYFDNLRLDNLVTNGDEYIDVKGYESDYLLSNFTYNAFDKNQNLVKNSSLNSLGAWTIAEINNLNTGESHVRIESDESQNKSVRLNVKNKKIFLAQRISLDSRTRTYNISVDYRQLRGAAGSFAVTQDGKTLTTKRLPPSTNWSNYHEIITVGQGESITLYLYANSSGENTTIQYDNVTVKPVENVRHLLSKLNDQEIAFDNLVAKYQRISPTKLRVDIKGRDGLLVFNESFSKNWKLTLKDKNDEDSGQGNKLTVDEHVLTNGFANGWRISGLNQEKNYIAIIEYGPQKLYFAGIVVSMIFLVIFLGCLAYVYLSRKLDESDRLVMRKKRN